MTQRRTGIHPLLTLVRRIGGLSGPRSRAGAGVGVLLVVVLLAALGALVLLRLFLAPGIDPPGTGNAPVGDALPETRSPAGDRPATEATPAAPLSPTSGLLVTVDACRRAGDAFVAEGWFRNQSLETVRYVEVMVTWLDSQGNEIGSDLFEVVSGETLMVGDSARFQVSTTEPRVGDCSAKLFSYDSFF